MNRILNGDFSHAFAGWTNPAPGGLAFNYNETQIYAFGASDSASTSTWTYKMCQQFNSSDEIITAAITVWADWATIPGGDTDGENQFIVELEKPDSSKVTLVDTTKIAVNGSGNILNGVDIKAHMATYGNYKLWLTLKTTSSSTYDSELGEWEYEESDGAYDNISIDVTVKKYKTVHEILGSSGKLGGKASVSRSEIVGLHESYSTEVSPGFLTLDPCDATTDWTTDGGSLSIDTNDKMEGVGSLKDDIALPIAGIWYQTKYNPTGTWDWSAKNRILFWLKCDRPNTAFTETRLWIWDTLNNYRYWNLTFSAGVWTAMKLLLSTGDGETGTPPDLALINYIFVRFTTADTTAFYKKMDDLRINTFNYKTASESVGLSESYSKLIKRIRGVVEVVGLSESIQAKRTQGNLETTYVLEDLTQWTQLSQTTTPWIKKKVEIA